MRVHSRFFGLMSLASPVISTHMMASGVGSSKETSQMAALPVGTHLDGVSPVKVYVYNSPVFDSRDMIACFRKSLGVAPWMYEGFDMAENMGEIWIHRAMLNHPWRVLDPNEADVFFIPLYPVLGMNLYKWPMENPCKMPNTNNERITAALLYLERKSTYFKRFGGADHIVVCTWWKCRDAFNNVHRMLLRRTVLGIYENIDYWAEWGCGDRLITVPYVASSAVTRSGVVGGLQFSERTVPFFFVGTVRGRLERRNLEVNVLRQMIKFGRYF